MKIHRCGECRHQADDHSNSPSGYTSVSGEKDRVGPCSFGGCACSLTVAEVTADNPAVEVTPIPDKWAVRS